VCQGEFDFLRFRIHDSLSASANTLITSVADYGLCEEGEMGLLFDEEVDLDDDTPDEEFNEDEW